MSCCFCHRGSDAIRASSTARRHLPRWSATVALRGPNAVRDVMPVASDRSRSSRLRTRAARADWPATCTCASLRRTDAERRMYQRSGGGMATTRQPTMLVQCVSLKPWLSYPGCDEPGGCHDLTLGRIYELLGIEADGAFYRIFDDSGGDYLYPASHFRVV